MTPDRLRFPLFEFVLSRKLKSVMVSFFDSTKSTKNTVKIKSLETFDQVGQTRNWSISITTKHVRFGALECIVYLVFIYRNYFLKIKTVFISKACIRKIHCIKALSYLYSSKSNFLLLTSFLLNFWIIFNVRNLVSRLSYNQMRERKRGNVSTFTDEVVLFLSLKIRR